MELQDVLQRMIDRGGTQGLHEKLDVFFAVGRISQEAYTALCEQLQA